MFIYLFIYLGDAIEEAVGSSDGIVGGGVGGLQVGVDAVNGPAPGFDWVEDGVKRVMLRHFVVAAVVLLIDKLDVDGVGVLEAGIELGDHRAA